MYKNVQKLIPSFVDLIDLFMVSSSFLSSSYLFSVQCIFEPSTYFYFVAVYHLISIPLLPVGFLKIVIYT